MDASEVQPLPQPQAQAPADPQAPPTDTPQEQEAGLPADILKLHPIQALIAGTPPATSMPIKEFNRTDAAKDIVKHADALKAAGFGFYKSLNGDTGVIFNALHIHPQDIQAADKAGKLEQLAPPWNKVSHLISSSGINHPALSGKGIPPAPAAPSPVAPPQAGSGQLPQPEPASAQRATQTARLMALRPGAPTSGAAPGQGRLLNSILKPVI